jgi:hypothetical protein
MKRVILIWGYIFEGRGYISLRNVGTLKIFDE